MKLEEVRSVANLKLKNFHNVEKIFSNKKDDCASEDDYELPTSFPQMSICSKRKKCALIIDDTKIIRKVFVRALTGMGFAVKQAENGLKGLLEMKTVMFDVVFCDFLMPLLDGLDCVQQYREWEKDNRPCFKQVRNIQLCLMYSYNTRRKYDITYLIFISYFYYKVYCWDIRTC
jgi:CheY-like chemotaxis protein